MRQVAAETVSQLAVSALGVTLAECFAPFRRSRSFRLPRP
jgi:hypothetical protein